MTMYAEAETSALEFCGSLAPMPTGRAPYVPAGVERREVTRVELCVGVGFLSDTNFYTGFTSNISEGGLFVATHMLQPVGSIITVTFALPGGAEITTRGIVRWVRDPSREDDSATPGMGVQFVGLREFDRARIRRFVSVREPMFYEA